MKWYLTLLIFLVVLLLYMFIQAILYKTRYYSLSTGIGVRFLHLSDIHIGLLFISAGRVKRTIKKARPDYILISGDSLDEPEHLRKLVKWLRDLEAEVPILMTYGNHEYRCFKEHPSFQHTFIEEMNQLGIKILVNKMVLLPEKPQQCEKAPREIALIGLDDCKMGIPVDRQIFSKLTTHYSCVLAFSHNPDIALSIPKNSVDLLITGHLHGGQMWMPFNLEYTWLRKDQVSKMGYSKGFATIGGNKIYISRGLGTVLFPLRFLSVPEITVFDV